VEMAPRGAPAPGRPEPGRADQDRPGAGGAPSVRGHRAAGAAADPSAAAEARLAAAPSVGRRLDAAQRVERPVGVVRRVVRQPAAVEARRLVAAEARRWGVEARLGGPVRSAGRPAARL